MHVIAVLLRTIQQVSATRSVFTHGAERAGSLPGVHVRRSCLQPLGLYCRDALHLVPALVTLLHCMEYHELGLAAEQYRGTVDAQPGRLAWWGHIRQDGREEVLREAGGNSHECMSIIGTSLVDSAHNNCRSTAGTSVRYGWLQESRGNLPLGSGSRYRSYPWVVVAAGGTR